MKIMAFTTTFWDDSPAIADAKRPELLGWLDRIEKFKPLWAYLATGCQDSPELNPLSGKAEFVSSGLEKTKPYDTFRYSYFLCAFEAALWHAINCRRIPWDFLVEMESDCWINHHRVDMPALLDEFQSRPEIIMAPAWFGRPDFNLLVMKRQAVPHFLHHRRRGNIVEEPLPLPMLPEDELAEIFKGMWFNPWPEVTIIRQQWGIPENPPHWRVTPDDEAKHWPVVALPSPAIKELFS